MRRITAAACALTIGCSSLHLAAASDQSTEQELTEAQENAAQLAEQIEALQEQIDRLAYESRSRASVQADLAPLIEALNSDDFDQRRQATQKIRRVLVDRIWSAAEQPGLSAEAQMRVHQAVIEASRLAQLTPVAVELSAADREALWRLINNELQWVLELLSDDVEVVSEALRRRPTGHEQAIPHVLTSLLQDQSRPLVQMAVLESDAMYAGNKATAQAAMDILRRALDAHQNTPHAGMPGQMWEQQLAQAQMNAAIAALSANPDTEVIAIADDVLRKPRIDMGVRKRLIDLLMQEPKLEHVQLLLGVFDDLQNDQFGQHQWQMNNVSVRSGDQELIAAADVLGIDLAGYEIEEVTYWQYNQITVLGFRNNDAEANRSKLHDEVKSLLKKRLNESDSDGGQPSGENAVKDDPGSDK